MHLNDAHKVVDDTASQATEVRKTTRSSAKDMVPSVHDMFGARKKPSSAMKEARATESYYASHCD